jgi:hypothetical protein
MHGSSKIADQLQQPVVLMIFGHEDGSTYSIVIRGRGDSANASRLQINHIVTSLRGLNVSFIMLLTSCYSEGWLLQSNLKVSGPNAAVRWLAPPSVLTALRDPRTFVKKMNKLFQRLYARMIFEEGSQNNALT